MIHVDKGTVEVKGTGKDVLSEISTLCLCLARNNVLGEVSVFDLIRDSVGIAENLYNKTKTEGEITS